MDSKHIVVTDPISWIIENKERLSKYFGSKTEIHSLRHRATITAKDSYDFTFRGWLFTMKYTSYSGTRTIEFVIDSGGYLRTVSGYGSDRTIYSQPLKYYQLYPELNHD